VLAEVFGRYEARQTVVSGAYGKDFGDDADWSELRARVARLAAERGRQPRLLIAKLGQDGHDRGQKVIASGLADLGFDVDIGPLFTTPAEVARQAIENDVHAVGVSTQAGAHLTLLPELVALLEREGAGDIVVVCGGIIPEKDHAALEAAGVRAVFGPGSRIVDVARRLLELVEDVAPGTGR
jgi:methylmalonyl-CoA mutase